MFVYKNYSDSPLTLEDELTDALTALRWTSALHGGFKACTLTAQVDLGRGWQYLRRENAAGRHFHHMKVMQGHELLWEGRIMDVAVGWTNANMTLQLTALGYYSSLRDQRITTVDYSGGTPTVDSIIKAMLSDKCPDINADQSGIDAVAGTVNLTLGVDKYAMDHIVENLAPLGDSSDNTYFFAVWDDRKAEYKARSVSDVTWEVPMSSIQIGQVRQAAQFLRNGANAYDGSSRTGSVADTDSQSSYPARDAVVSVPSGTTTGRAEDARDRFISERKDPQQDSSLTIRGPIFHKGGVNRPLGNPRASVRAGDVLKVIDIVPGSAASPTLDNLRTFFLLETTYDAFADRLKVVPDRPPSRLDILLARAGIEIGR